MQRSREPRRDDRLDRFLAPAVEMIAVRDDLHVARTAGTRAEILGGIVFPRLLVAADVERRALHFGRELEHIGRLGQPVEEALRADSVPPPGYEHELAAATRLDHLARPRCKLLDMLAHHQPRFSASLDNI